MLLELCTMAKYVLEKRFSKEMLVPDNEVSANSGIFETASVHFSLIEIDHMRDRRNYLKILTRWSKELALTGRVIFCNTSRRIFLLLTTSDVGVGVGCDALKDFLVRLRTSNIDVDSSGRPCKERLASVLMPPTKLDLGENPFRDFSVSEIPDEKNRDLESFFSDHGLGEVFSRCLKKL